MLNNTLGQTAWPGPVLTTGNWRDYVRDRVTSLDWQRVVTDVSPFLEPSEDIALMTLENILQLLSR